MTADCSAGFMITVLPVTSAAVVIPHTIAMRKFKGVARGFDRASCFWNSGFGHVADDVFGRARDDRSDRFLGSNFFAVDFERILLAELRTHMRERFPHSVLILFVDEIHKRRVFISITGGRIEGSAVAANFDMPRAVRTLRYEFGWIAQ